jgi:arylsulfatase
MADDMGYSDLGCMGSKIRTPNIDKLAADGVLFRHCYNNAKCSPTRASLLTGLHPHQTDVGIRVGKANSPDEYDSRSEVGSPGHRGDLNKRCATLAELLRSAGYRTYMSGKWHITRYIAGPKHNWPLQRGFDRFFGTLWGCGSYFNPKTLTRDNEPIKAGSDFYYTDEISTNAAQFVRDHAADSSGVPFFLYVAYTAPHYPLMALEEDIKRYEDRYSQGWDALRRERYARMVQLGLVDEKWRLSPRPPEVEDWDDLPVTVQRRYAQLMATYAAMVDRMDQGVGQIIDTLNSLGLTDNTVVFFLSDNGATAETGGAKYGPGWANACNTPYRRFKTTLYEGGIITPLIVRWPRGVQDAGRIVAQPCQVIDVVPTCLDIARVDYPDTHDGHQLLPLEGFSLRPAMEGRKLPEKTHYWRYLGNGAIRQGKWKLIRGKSKNWELYDTNTDATELNDLASQHPKLVEEMLVQWQQWEDRTMPHE